MIDSTPWVTRRHRGPRAEPVPLTAEQREQVEAVIRPAKAEARIVRRGQALLLLADGVSADDVAAIMHVNVKTAWEWKKRFKTAADPVAALADAPRSGRPRALSRK